MADVTHLTEETARVDQLHTAHAVADAATISASVDDMVMHAWRLLAQDTATPARYMHQPVVEWPRVAHCPVGVTLSHQLSSACSACPSKVRPRCAV